MALLAFAFRWFFPAPANEVSTTIQSTVKKEMLPVAKFTQNTLNKAYVRVHRSRIDAAKDNIRKIATIDSIPVAEAKSPVRTPLISAMPAPTSNVSEEQASFQPKPPAHDVDSTKQSQPKLLTSVENKIHRTFKVLLIGVDTRLGKSSARADAIHLLCVDLDEASIEIVSIPRGTIVPPVEKGIIISHVRQWKGRNGLMQCVSKCTGKGTISYFVEVGLSQAMGILELLGYANPVSELQSLRQRKGYQFGDIERSYAQARFIRKTLLRHFELLTGVTGDLLLTAGLSLVETNLTKDICQGVIYALKEQGFPRSEEAVAIDLRSRFEKRIVAKTKGEADGERELRRKEMLLQEQAQSIVQRKIRSALHHASMHVDAPSRVVADLGKIYEQRGWLQIQNHEIRKMLRDSLLHTLQRALVSQGKKIESQKMERTASEEDALYQRLGAARKVSAATNAE